jgi:UDP-glucose 4-epimerase
MLAAPGPDLRRGGDRNVLPAPGGTPSMDLTGRDIVVTGGAGFVGSHLAERLIDENDVTVVDDCSHGVAAWVPDAATLVEGDLADPEVAAAAVDADCDLVVHCAAGKAVDAANPRGQFERNLDATYTLLDRCREVGVDRLAYTSSSTVYGEAPRPTPEDHAGEPISAYGAGKLAEEGLCSVHAHSHGMRIWTFRFANVVGPRLREGAVVPDFIAKLREDPSTLEILGDGRQEKSYMHIADCVDAMCHVIEHADAAHNVYNLGTRTTTSVRRIADIVSDELGCDPEYEFTGGDRGWVGDVPRMRLSIEKLEALGWTPSIESDDAIRRCVQELTADG